MIKIIFSDMDGTLLNDRSQLPAGFDDLMLELKARNVIFAPASGRQYFSLLRSFGKYEDDFLFVAENGTLAIQHRKEIFSKPMLRAESDEVLAAGDAWDNIFRVYCGKRGASSLKITLRRTPPSRVLPRSTTSRSRCRSSTTPLEPPKRFIRSSVLDSADRCRSISAAINGSM